MFKSIKWKLVIMFTLMIVSVIIIVGTFFRITISNYYINEFRSNVENAFAGDFFSQIVSASESDDAIDRIASIIDGYAGRIGISSSRNVYVLDGKTGGVIYRADKSIVDNVEKTPNIIAAMVTFPIKQHIWIMPHPL